MSEGLNQEVRELSKMEQSLGKTAEYEIVNGVLPALMPAFEVDAFARRQESIDRLHAQMKPGIHYGCVPGTDKPALFKSGAEMACNFFALTPVQTVVDRVEDWTGRDHDGEPLFHYEVETKIYRYGPYGYLLAVTRGSCNSWEKKYRYRLAERSCPDCNKPTIRKSKPEWGGGWYCNRNGGGCGAKFSKDDSRITEQETGRVPNPEPHDIVNTILKMAEKRSLTAAVLLATGMSHKFLEADEDEVDQPDPRVSRPQSSADRPTSRNASPEAAASSSSQSAAASEGWGKKRQKLEEVLGSLPEPGTRERDVARVSRMVSIANLDAGQWLQWLKERGMTGKVVSAMSAPDLRRADQLLQEYLRQRAAEMDDESRRAA